MISMVVDGSGSMPVVVGVSIAVSRSVIGLSGLCPCGNQGSLCVCEDRKGWRGSLAKGLAGQFPTLTSQRLSSSTLPLPHVGSLLGVSCGIARGERGPMVYLQL